MKYTDTYRLPYPEPEDFAEYGAQLQSLATRADEVLTGFDVDQAFLAAPPTFHRNMTAPDTGFGSSLFTVFFTNTLEMSGGWTTGDFGTARSPDNAALYPSLWRVSASLILRPSGGTWTDNAAHGMEVQQAHSDPVTGEYVWTRRYASESGSSAPGVANNLGLQVNYLARLIAPTEFEVYYCNNNATSMDVLADTALCIAYIGACG